MDWIEGAILLLATSQPLSIGPRYNIGWGSGLIPFLMVGVPVLIFMIGFELNRRKRD